MNMGIFGSLCEKTRKKKGRWDFYGVRSLSLSLSGCVTEYYFFFYQFVHFKFLLTFAYFGRAKPSMVKVKTEKFLPFFFFFFNKLPSTVNNWR